MTNAYTIYSKEKYFVLNDGKKHYFSSINKVSVSVFGHSGIPEFSFYKEDPQNWIPTPIPARLAQDLVNMFHVPVDFGGSKSVFREIK